MTKPVPRHQDALHLADHAFLETQDSNAHKVRNAIAAYEWGQDNRREFFEMIVYPSLQELRDAFGGFQ